MVMKKVLLLTDFSDAARNAIRFAQALFRETPVEFSLLHVYQIETDALYAAAYLLDEAKDASFKRLHEELQTVTDTPANHSYRLLNAPGTPVTVVDALLEREGYDFVVVGATGAGLFPVLGSVATGLIRSAAANVLVVPESAKSDVLRQVVLAVPYPGALPSADVLKPLTEIQSISQAELTALSIVETNFDHAKAGDFDEHRAELAAQFGDGQATPYFIMDDNIGHGIETYLETNEVDLLVTVPHRKSLLDVLWNRSVTRQLAYNPLVPLLALYSGD